MTKTGSFAGTANNTTASVDVILSHADKPNTTHSTKQGASVTLNDKPVKLADLHVGDAVTLTGDPVSGIAAKR